MNLNLESLHPTDMSGARPAPTVAGHLFDCTTRHKFELIDLTQQVEQLVAKSGVREGIALVQSLHSTTGLFVNEWQGALLEDFRTLLEQAVRDDLPWRHNDPRCSDCDRSNAASHLRALLLGTSVMLAVRGGQLVRGAWQSIILAELDGPRTRSISFQALGA